MVEVDIPALGLEAGSETGAEGLSTQSSARSTQFDAGADGLSTQHSALGTPPDAGDEPTVEAPVPRTRSRAKAPASLITVNIGVPRGLSRRVNSKLIDRVVQAALQREGWQTPAVLDVHIVDDEEMREVNATRRGIDEATDVLSFPLIESKPGQGVTEDFFVLPPDEAQHLGEILIAFPRVETQADEAGHSRERELAFLTAHGVLHILGYDHENDNDRRQMRRREEEVLGELGLSRNGS